MFKEMFDNWFSKQCKKAWENASKKEAIEEHKRVNNKSRRKKDDDENDDILSDSSCYTLKMKPAVGGTIVQVQYFNQKNNLSSIGEWSKDLYIIPENEDIGEQIKSILVQYRLKHTQL
jgi:hypothetical protein